MVSVHWNWYEFQFVYEDTARQGGALVKAYTASLVSTRDGPLTPDIV